MNSSTNKFDNCSGEVGAEPELKLTVGLLTPAKLMLSCPEVVKGDGTAWAAELEAVVVVGSKQQTVEYGRLEEQVVLRQRPAPLRGIEVPAL